MKPATSIEATGTQTLEIISRASRFNQWMYETIRPHINGRVLELGSGIGNISHFLLEDGYKTVLSDYYPHYQRRLFERFGNYSNLENVANIDLQDSQFETHQQPYQAHFDTIILLNVIEHLANDVTAVNNCRFLLKPGGAFIVLAPAYSFLLCNLDKNLGHFRRYTCSSLGSLLEKEGFSVVKKNYFNMAGIAGWLFSGKLLRQNQLSQNEMGLFNKLVPLFKIADSLFMKKIGLSAIVVGRKK